MASTTFQGSSSAAAVIRLPADLHDVSRALVTLLRVVGLGKQGARALTATTHCLRSAPTRYQQAQRRILCGELFGTVGDTSSTTLNSEDREVMQDMAHAHPAEIDTGKMALEKGHSVQVKKFAHR